MRLNPLSLMGGAYADNSLTWSAQRTLNWLPETAEVEGTRTPIKFADPPGLRAVVDLGTGAPIRGIENVEGTLFVVSGTTLFEIASDYTATNRGNIPGVGRVSMAHNKQGGAPAANQLAIANGLSGYVYNTSTNVLSQITDESFEGASTVDYIDGFITFTDPQGRFWGHSALNQAGEYSTIDRYDAESAPDPIISHIASHREAIVFGTRTTEFFRNTGAATNTFQRVDGTELEVGICSTFARARVDNSVCWVSDSLEVFRLEGHSPQRISTRPIEQLLHTVNPANIFAFSWEDRGHKVFYITAPEAFTLGFDFASGMWHERQTFDLPRWRVNALASWNNRWIAGDYTNGLLYELDWDTHHENGLELIRERASGYTHGGQNKVLAPYVELLFDTGTEGPDPLTISGDLPDSTTGTPIPAFSYSAAGGISPYSFVIQSGALPAGLSMSSAGAVTGTPTTAGIYSWSVRVTDASGDIATLADSATVSQADHGFLYVSNTDSGTVSVRNATTLAAVTTVSVGVEPRGCCAMPDFSAVYVPNRVSGTVSAIDPDTNTVAATIPITGASGLLGAAASPDGSKVYVCNSGAGKVEIINPVNNTHTGSITVGAGPANVCFLPDGSAAYTANRTTGSVSVINPATNTVTATIPGIGTATGIAAKPDGSEVYVTRQAIGLGVEVINTATNTVVATITVGNLPNGVTFSADGAKAYVANTSSGNVSVINTATRLVIATITVGSSPRGMARSPDGTKIIVTNAGGNSISAINTATDTASAPVTVGFNPDGVAFA